MKKITLISLLTLVFGLISLPTVANVNAVGPEADATLSTENNTDFKWLESLLFTSTSQYVFANPVWDSNNPNNLQFTLITTLGHTGTIFLSTKNKGNYLKKQCAFTVKTDNNGVITLNNKTLPGAYITCTLTGSASNNDLKLDINYSALYMRTAG